MAPEEKNAEIPLKQLLESANREKASDIHLKVGYYPILRINGVLEPLEFRQLKTTDTDQVAKSLLSEEDYIKLKNSGDVDAKFKQFSSRYRIHASTDDNGINIAIRVVPDEIIPIEKLGFPYHDIWKAIIGLKQGLVLVTGKTGSGKTTTIASLIEKINQERAEHIITLEDPIEYVYTPKKSIISQRQIRTHVKSFEDGLEGALRQDPNIIVIGEIRNRETARTAVDAALTGHLVFSTLHSYNSVETVKKMVSKFSADEQNEIREALTSASAFYISQQLIPVKDGRVLAMEVLNIKDCDFVKSHIRDSKDHLLMSDLQTGHQFGMITMNQCLRNLYEEGKINEADLQNYSFSPKDY